MKIRVLGCDGGRAKDYKNTSLMFNDTVLIDAGTVLSEITVEEAINITDIFFTHTHLDHILELPFMLDVTFGQRKTPLRLHGLKESLDPLMEHMFNDKIWPNFAELPTAEDGQFTLHEIKPDEVYEAQGLKFTPFAVNHTVPCVGYKVESGGSALVFSGDTGPVDSVWDVANAADNLKALIVDLSFPTEEQHIADVSGHMTANDVQAQLEKLRKDCDVYTFHHKVGLSPKLKEQAKHLTHMNKPVQHLRDVEILEI